MPKPFKKIFYLIYDLMASLIGLLLLPVLKITRKYGVEHFPLQSALFKWVGIFPIRDHYYEPRFVFEKDFDASKVRAIAFDLGLPEQIALLQSLDFVKELKQLPIDTFGSKTDFFINNPNFGAGDAELYYLMLRNRSPKKIIEIGAGYSTMLCLKAIEKNREEGHECELVCIEPFEMPFLNAVSNITLIRSEVEKLDIDLFKTLRSGDILFIDSSHIIRPGNDLLFIFFQILPALQKGVLIHIHDIFTPRHYPQEWLTRQMRFWNEQYLLEAFLYNNREFKILFTINHLIKSHFEEARKVLIHLQPNSEPSSFWMEKG